MRKLCITLLAVAVAVMLVPGVALALDGPHSTSFPAGTSCMACHTPHNGKNVAGQLLWGQTITTETFTPYSSPTLDSAPTFVGGLPTGSSVLCLSCHDGATTIDALATPGPMAAGPHVIGTDLSNDHPVSMTYDDVADTGLKAVGILNAVLVLEAGKVECGTCHNPHDNTTYAHYLAVDEADICTECHANK